MNIHQLSILLSALILSSMALASPVITITPTQPIAEEPFDIKITEDSFPNGCVPNQIFSVRLRSGNKLEVTALPPLVAFCTQVISSYSLKDRTIINEPGNYTLEYHLSFNSAPVASLPFTVLPNSSADDKDSYDQGYADGQAACLSDPQSCGILIDPVIYHGGVLNIPEVRVVGPFNEVGRYSAILNFIPFSEPFQFELESAELLAEDEE